MSFFEVVDVLFLWLEASPVAWSGQWTSFVDAYKDYSWYRVAEFLSLRRDWDPPPCKQASMILDWSHTRGGGTNSDEGTDTLVLYVQVNYNPSTEKYIAIFLYNKKHQFYFLKFDPQHCLKGPCWPD